MNEELIALLEKAGITTDNTGGLLNTEQADKFIQTTVDQSDFLKTIRVERNIGTSRDLDHIGVGTRLIHKPVESVEPDASKLRGITTGKRTLTPVEIMLPYNVSLKWLEDNIARENAEEEINTAFSRQFSNDLVDLILNGDLDTDVAHEDYEFLTILNGVMKRMVDDSNKQYYNRSGSTDWKSTVFPALVKMIPDKYKADPTRLRIYTSFDAEEEYREQLSERATALGDTYLTEKKRATYKGIIVEPLPNMPYGKTLITTPLNIAAGFGREISVWRQFKPRARNVEYTISAKIDTNYVLSDWNVFTV